MSFPSILHRAFGDPLQQLMTLIDCLIAVARCLAHHYFLNINSNEVRKMYIKPLALTSQWHYSYNDGQAETESYLDTRSFNEPPAPQLFGYVDNSPRWSYRYVIRTCAAAQSTDLAVIKNLSQN